MGPGWHLQVPGVAQAGRLTPTVTLEGRGAAKRVRASSSLRLNTPPTTPGNTGSCCGQVRFQALPQAGRAAHWLSGSITVRMVRSSSESFSRCPAVAPRLNTSACTGSQPITAATAIPACAVSSA